MVPSVGDLGTNRRVSNTSYSHRTNGRSRGSPPSPKGGVLGEVPSAFDPVQHIQSERRVVCVIRIGYLISFKDRRNPGGVNVIYPIEGEVNASRSGLGQLSPVKWEVVSYVHASLPCPNLDGWGCPPGVNHPTLTILDGLVKVKSVQVECHRATPRDDKPDTNNKYSEEKVETPTVVKRSVLEDKSDQSNRAQRRCYTFPLLDRTCNHSFVILFL